MEDNYNHLVDVISLYGGESTSSYEDRANRYFGYISSYKEQYPEMAFELKRIVKRAFQKGEINFYLLATDLEDAARDHWRLAPAHLISVIMYSMLEKPRPYAVEPQDLLRKLKAIHNIALAVRADMIRNHRNDEVREVAVHVIAGLLPDVCIALMPAILHRVEDLQEEVKSYKDKLARCTCQKGDDGKVL